MGTAKKTTSLQRRLPQGNMQKVKLRFRLGTCSTLLVGRGTLLDGIKVHHLEMEPGGLVLGKPELVRNPRRGTR